MIRLVNLEKLVGIPTSIRMMLLRQLFYVSDESFPLLLQFDTVAMIHDVGIGGAIETN